MPDRLTGAWSPVARVLVVVLAFAAVGAAAGWAWEALWEPPSGVVYEGRWFLDTAGPEDSFSGAALYVVLGLPAGLLLGALAGLLPGREAVTLGAVVLGSLLAGWVMYAVGHALGPADPRVLAAAEPDYERVSAALVLAAPGESTSPFRSTALAAFPIGSLAGLAIVYLSGFRARQHG